jgi:hypothetical protein
MEHSMASPSINMILLLTRTIPDGEITRTYTMGTYLNKTIKADSSTPWILAPIELLNEIAPAFTNFNYMRSSSDDLCEMMKTLASNIITLQQNFMSLQQ